MKTIKSLECVAKQEKLMQLFTEICNSGQYAEGSKTVEAEAALTLRFGKTTSLFNSCGSALYTAYRYYASQGHELAVIQNNTFYATGQMAIEAGITPVLCDSRPDCPSMSFDSMVEAVQKSEARIVVLTHVGGFMAKDYMKILRYCVENSIVLIEDCAHAFGLPVGRGTCACWSFYPTKALPIGEGGALSSNNTELIDFAIRFRNYGKCVIGGEIFYDIGMNLRISEWNAAVLLLQLEYWPHILRARTEDAKKLQFIAPSLLKIEEGPSNWYKYCVDKKFVEGYKTVGSVYKRSDQLDQSLRYASFKTPVSLENSHKWTEFHCCLPIGENIYVGLSVDQVRKYLCQ